MTLRNIVLDTEARYKVDRADYSLYTKFKFSSRIPSLLSKFSNLFKYFKNLPNTSLGLPPKWNCVELWLLVCSYDLFHQHMDWFLILRSSPQGGFITRIQLYYTCTFSSSQTNFLCTYSGSHFYDHKGVNTQQFIYFLRFHLPIILFCILSLYLILLPLTNFDNFSSSDIKHSLVINAA